MPKQPRIIDDNRNDEAIKVTFGNNKGFNRIKPFDA